MGADVYIEIDKGIISFNHEILKDLRDINGNPIFLGSGGYLRKPYYSLPGWDGPEVMDFIGETPKVLELIRDQINEVLSDIENSKRYTQDGKPDPKFIIASLEELEDKYVTLIDFFRLGCQLQSAGKEPKIHIYH